VIPASQAGVSSHECQVYKMYASIKCLNAKMLKCLNAKMTKIKES